MTESWNKVLFTSLQQAREWALQEASKSPCVRRKYGSVLTKEDTKIAAAHNNRVSRCCDGMCIRDTLKITHGHNTDLGAEIHSEQSLFVHTRYNQELFFIAGYNREGKELFGKECWPCYSCARICKEAGVRNLWVAADATTFEAFSIDLILERYEQEILGAHDYV